MKLSVTLAVYLYQDMIYNLDEHQQLAKLHNLHLFRYGSEWIWCCLKNYPNFLTQGGHCPGNQGNQVKVRESEKGLKWPGNLRKTRKVSEKSGNLNSYLKVQSAENRRKSVTVSGYAYVTR